MIPKTRQDAIIALKTSAQAQGDRFDITACAFACSIHENPDRDVSGALDVLADLTRIIVQRAPADVHSFTQILYGEFGFCGCESDYDAPENADFIDILLRRQGIPIGLGHVWRHGARAINAPIYGTDTPGHFILRFETSEGPVFIDPFEGGALLDDDAQDDIARRAGLKTLSARMLSPVSDRVMAVRLQTNLIARARMSEDHEAWFRASFRRSVLAPSNYQVALDFSQAAQATGQLKTALEWANIAAGLPDAPQSERLSAQQRTQNLNKALN